MKKKTLFLVGLTALTLVACSGNETATNDTKPKGTVNVTEEKTDKKNLPDVTVDQLPYEMNILPADSSGTVYGEMTFTNNSKYPMKYFNATINMLDKNEKTYYISPDTVMPGETSPKFESFSSPDPESNEILMIEYTYVDDKDKEVYVEYDVKLNQYDFYSE